MTDRPLVLSLFPGLGLLDMAFEAEGFCVVRGPDIILGQDIRDWHATPGKFDGVIGGPPCKMFSRAMKSHGKEGHLKATQGNLIPEFERIVREAQPKWWVMENVDCAPKPDLPGLRSGVLWNALHYGAPQFRRRRFSSNLPLHEYRVKLPEDQWHPDPWPAVTATEYKASAGSNERTMRQRASRKVGRRMTLEEVNDAMGLPKDFKTPMFLLNSNYEIRGNGVPIPLGRAVARAVKACLEAGEPVAEYPMLTKNISSEGEGGVGTV